MSSITMLPLATTQQERLNTQNKQDKLVSGINIKTINKQSILGSGNLDIPSSGDSDLNIPIDLGDSKNSIKQKGEYKYLTKTYQNNAVSPLAVALGGGTNAGLKGYYYSKVSIANKQIALSTSQPSVIRNSSSKLTSDGSLTCGYSVGDRVSIQFGDTFPFCNTIESIDGNVLTMEEDLPITSDKFILNTSTVTSGVGSITNLFEFIICSVEATHDDSTYEINVRNWNVGLVDVPGSAALAEGVNTYAVAMGAHTEGIQTVAAGQFAHAEGYNTLAKGKHTHVEGHRTEAIGEDAHAEGKESHAEGETSHAEGKKTTAKGDNSHAEGGNTTANGNYSHAEGYKTTANGGASHAEGSSTEAGENAHAEGLRTKATGDNSHAEGQETQAIGTNSHSEGYKSKANGTSAHAEGEGNSTEALCSHVEGYSNIIYKDNTDSSHAEGENNIVNNGAYASHVEGEYNQVNNRAEHASGQYNKSTKSDDGSQATHFSIGIGTSDTDRKNAFEVKQDGKVYIKGVGNYGVETSDVVEDLATVISFLQQEIEQLKTQLTTE